MDISVLAPHLQQPIADLVTKLLATSFRKSDRISTGFYENGYAASAILILAAMIESMIQRDRYFLLKAKPQQKVSNKTSEYLKLTLHYRRHTHVQELFELRNALAHNHMWEVEYTLPISGNRVHKHSSVVVGTHRLTPPPKSNARVPRTERIRFNLLSSRVDRTDLVKALEVCNHALAFLVQKGQRPVNILRNTVSVSKNREPFSNLSNIILKSFKLATLPT